MSIQNLLNTQAPGEARRSSSRPAPEEPIGASFQSRLEEASAEARQPRAGDAAAPIGSGGSTQEYLAYRAVNSALTDPVIPAGSAYGLDSSMFLGGGLQETLYNAKLDMLDRMEEGKEKTEEEQAWDRLMAYVDAWIKSIQREAEMNKEAAEKAARISKDFKKEIEAAQLERKDRLADFLLDGLRKKLL